MRGRTSWRATRLTAATAAEEPAGDPGAGGRNDQRGGGDGRKKDDRARVNDEGKRRAGRPSPSNGRAAADLLPEAAPAPVHQVIADVGGPARGRVVSEGLGRETDGGHRRRLFVPGRARGDLLDGVPVTVARLELLGRVSSGRVAPEGPLDDALAFDEFPPVHGAEEAETGDVVGHGNAEGGLLVAVRLEDLVGAQAVVGQLALEPAQDDF